MINVECNKEQCNKCVQSAALDHFRRRGCGLFSRNERNAALGFMKGRGLVDTTFESAPDAAS